MANEQLFAKVGDLGAFLHSRCVPSCLSEEENLAAVDSFCSMRPQIDQVYAVGRDTGLVGSRKQGKPATTPSCPGNRKHSSR